MEVDTSRKEKKMKTELEEKKYRKSKTADGRKLHHGWVLQKAPSSEGNQQEKWENRREEPEGT